MTEKNVIENINFFKGYWVRVPRCADGIWEYHDEFFDESGEFIGTKKAGL